MPEEPLIKVTEAAEKVSYFKYKNYHKVVRQLISCLVKKIAILPLL